MYHAGTFRAEYRYNDPMSEQKITRRNFMRAALLSAASLVSGFSVLGYSTQVEPAWLDVTDVHLALKRLAPAFSGLRLAQISDIHLGGWMNTERLNHVVKTVLDLHPDVVLLTGDYLLGHHWEQRHAALLEQMAPILLPLTQAAPAFAVMGNHDHWTSAAAVRRMLAKAGITELRNGVQTLTRGADQLHLAGVDSAYDGHDRLDLVLNQLPADGAAILLAHEPDFADFSARYGRFDLQVSGHTHGGQVVLPIIGRPATPELGHKYPAGLYRVGDMYQYTNRGVGMSVPPVRFNCRPEITVFTLETAKNQA